MDFSKSMSVAAYRTRAQIARMQGVSSEITPANAPAGIFSDFLSGAIKDSINTMRQGEHAASQQVQGKANLVDVVQSVNAAELTLDTCLLYTSDAADER